MDSFTTFDPTGTVEAAAQPAAPRVSATKGARLAVLNNTKWNASKLLRLSVAEMEALGAKFDSVRFYDKHHFSSDADPALLDRIAAENDIVLTAIGDCGSCTSSCVNDGIQMELRGLPAAVIVTTEFEREATLQKRAHGMDELQPVVITHPISSLAPDLLSGRAREVAPQALSIWVTGERPAARV
ncbi:UGSC family (seleno)protein [Amycolatopsis sp. NPDC051903]|uniref:UGSC family (seleno)protein n=1 Tax=Amycolatopsis sp. NPDC051903 TaxID=3363936 RepID=UPI0037B2350F